MKRKKFNQRDTRFAPWTALCLLTLIAAMVFAAPSVVFAQITGVLSQDCDTAIADGITEHTITATVTNGGVPVEGVILIFQVAGPNYVPGVFGVQTGPDGTFPFTYTNTNLGLYTTSLIMPTVPGPPVQITTEWTADDQCSESVEVEVGGWDKLKDKKWGGVSIAICGVGCPDSFNVYDVELESVQMAGVSPWRSRFRDSRLCEGVKDGYVDLVLRFKRREVLHALEEALGGELLDGEEVTLEVTGTLKDGTPFKGEWKPMIKKSKKRRKWHKWHKWSR